MRVTHATFLLNVVPSAHPFIKIAFKNGSPKSVRTQISHTCSLPAHTRKTFSRFGSSGRCTGCTGRCGGAGCAGWRVGDCARAFCTSFNVWPISRSCMTLLYSLRARISLSVYPAMWFPPFLMDFSAADEAIRGGCEQHHAQVSRISNMISDEATRSRFYCTRHQTLSPKCI
jgi:hypothetical protein